MTSDIAAYQQPTSVLRDQMDFATAVTVGERGSTSILPDVYRNNPANVLIAVGLGQAMGLSPAESLYRIAVIKGKPSASAELIAANVRKAGHKLRIKVTEDPPSATCTIIRADDPDEPTVIVRDMPWAQRMGLAGEPNYKKQPSTMLSYRAITACARLACPEALYGVTYTPDELEDQPSEPRRQTPAQTPTGDLTAELLGEVVEDPQGTAAPPQAATRRMFALFKEAGFPSTGDEARTFRLDYCSQVLGRPVESSNDLTPSEVAQVCDSLDVDIVHNQQDGAGADTEEGS